MDSGATIIQTENMGETTYDFYKRTLRTPRND